MDGREKEDALTLEILEAIDESSDVTQRGLAQRTGVALGLANSYLKRCVRKGYVKIKQAPANRYLYYLTPKGFAEKSRLTGQYLSYSFGFYRKASDSCVVALRSCRERGWKRVLLCGVSELAEIASLRAPEAGVGVIGVYDPAAGSDRFLGFRIRRTLDRGPAFDACLITELTDPVSCRTRLLASLEPERVVVPSILGMTTPGERSLAS